MSRLPLSKPQVVALSIEAKKAWEALPAPDREAALAVARYNLSDEDGKLTLKSGKVFDHWRREEQFLACGKASCTEMVNSDFDRVMARWKHHQGAGAGPLAKEAWDIEAHADERRLRHVILETCKTAGFSPNYAQTICQDKGFGLSLEEAGADLLRQVLSTLNNRVRHSERRKAPRKAHDWRDTRTFAQGRGRVATAANAPEKPLRSLESLKTLVGVPQTSYPF